jgi:hypothetical protein
MLKNELHCNSKLLSFLGVHDVLKMEFLDVRRKAVKKRLFQILVALEIPFFEMVVMLDVLGWDCEMWVFVMLFPFEVCGLMGGQQNRNF